MPTKEKIIIGRNETVDFARYGHKVPAKIDTGADSSSVWVSNVRVDKMGILRFNLFGEGSPFYTSKTIKREKYQVAMIRSASGHQQIRYRTQLSVRIGGRRIRAMFNLSDRSQHIFPVLIGKRTLRGKFVVDVAKARYQEPEATASKSLGKKLTKDPYKFYRKYYKKTGVSLRKKI